MDYTEYTTIKNRFGFNPNMCDLFKILSIETWKRIEYAYLKPGIKVFETTITQNLIFTLNAYKDQYGLNLEIFEATDENTNGNDLELIIQYPSEGLEFYMPIQAKKVYRKGKYNSMDHGAQIDSLIKYADDKNAIPFYLLYNYIDAPIKKGISLTTPAELTGCTLVPARHLFDKHYKIGFTTNPDGSYQKYWHIPHFYDLNPSPSFPWHELACPSTSNELFKHLIAKKVYKDIHDEVKNDQFEPPLTSAIVKNDNFRTGFLPFGTITRDKHWLSIEKFKKTDMSTDAQRYESILSMEDSNRTTLQKTSNEKEKVLKEFSPKSRIVISK